MLIVYCRAENSLSNDNNYLILTYLLTKLQTSEATTVKTHRIREMANQLLLINIYGEND